MVDTQTGRGTGFFCRADRLQTDGGEGKGREGKGSAIMWTTIYIYIHIGIITCKTCSINEMDPSLEFPLSFTATCKIEAPFPMMFFGKIELEILEIAREIAGTIMRYYYPIRPQGLCQVDQRSKVEWMSEKFVLDLRQWTCLTLAFKNHDVPRTGQLRRRKQCLTSDRFFCNVKYLLTRGVVINKYLGWDFSLCYE